MAQQYIHPRNKTRFNFYFHTWQEECNDDSCQESQLLKYMSCIITGMYWWDMTVTGGPDLIRRTLKQNWSFLREFWGITKTQPRNGLYWEPYRWRGCGHWGTGSKKTIGEQGHWSFQSTDWTSPPTMSVWQAVLWNLQITSWHWRVTPPHPSEGWSWASLELLS